MNTHPTVTSAKKTNRYSSVLDLVKATSEPEQARDFETRLAETGIIRALIRIRAQAGMTQGEIAAKMNCTQSAVSKLENSADGDLTVREIASYLCATGGRFGIGFGKPLSLVERIKASAMSLRSDLETLAELSSKSDDAEIRKNIDVFFGQAWFNLSLILMETTAKLPQEPKGKKASPVRILDVDTAKLRFKDNPVVAEC